jgi:hypothetical protein
MLLWLKPTRATWLLLLLHKLDYSKERILLWLLESWLLWL